jgi:predicted nicotinamide N-methyase
VELVEEIVDLGELRLRIKRPPNPGDLIDQERFAQDEYMPYWAEMWSAGVALARHVTQLNLAGRRVLEVGAGLGLPSLAAAVGGAHVLATDWAHDALPLLRENAERNGTVVATLAADWRRPPEFAARGPWDLVLAADVLYENRNVAPLVELLRHLGTPAIVGDPGRPYLEPFRQAIASDFRVDDSHPDADHPRLTLMTLTP